MNYNFDASFEEVIGSEGGFQNDPDDRGNWTGGSIGSGSNRGTKYGVSAASYPNVDIRNLTLADAKAIYKEDYWDACHCDELPSGADFLTFDIGVNHGIRDGVVALQYAAGTTGDGIFGPNTRAAVKRTDPSTLRGEMCVWRMKDYARLDHLSKYWTGWFRRIVSTLRFSDELALNEFKEAGEKQAQAKPANDNESWFGFRRVNA